MNTKKVIAGMAELIAKRGMYKLEPMLIEALKEYYGVDEMYFWKDSADWEHCSDGKPKSNDIWSPNGPEHVSLTELTWILHGLEEGTLRIEFDGQYYTNLDEIKRYALTKKLAGIK